MKNNDPMGYYKVLGVQPDASISVIKAAYKAQAMDMHPDRNPGKDTTAKFQTLQEAFAIVSDEKLRQQYDADSAVPASDSNAAKDSYKPLEPIVCSKCSAISAQPRFKVFYTVFSYIFGATKKSHQGIFCSKCEIKVALRSSATTLLTGWWSIAGFIWTLHTLIQNLTGGQFNEQNARLQGYQAMYFAQIGKSDLARAVAIESIKLIDKFTKENNKKFAFKAKLGYEQTNPLIELKETLTNFIDSFPKNSKVSKLKSSNMVFNKRFAYQLLLLGTFAALVSGAIYRDHMQDVEAERIRLVQQGIEQSRAAAIAENKAEELRRMEKPLPRSGIFTSSNRIIYDKHRSPTLKIKNSPNANTLIKLDSISDGTEVMSVFIRAGETIEVSVPIGDYIAKLASGQTWYGEKIRFGPNTSYSKLDTDLKFYIKGNELIGNEIKLTRVINGNLKQLPLTATEF